MLSSYIEEIKNDLDKYKKYSKNDMFTESVQEKLKNTLINYDYDMERNSEFLLSRDSAKVLKAITKIQMKDNRKALEEASENKENE